MNDRLIYKMDGPIFQKGVPLHLVTGGLAELHHVIDKTYVVLTGKKRLSKTDRKQFQIISHDFRSGSFITEFEILLLGTQLLLPLFTEYGPKNIWEYTKETFSFLKLVFTSSKAGEKPTYTHNDDSSVTVTTGDTQHNYYGPVTQIGKLVLPTYQKYMDMLSNGGIENISIGKREEPEIDLTLKDKNLFRVRSSIDDDPIVVECDIFDFNKFKNAGKIVIAKDQPLPEGEYSFSILGSQETHEYILSMLKTNVKIKCLKEKIIDPLGETIIKRLHVTGVISED